MTATVLSETPLPGLPSASGIEIIGLTAYVVSDDSPDLYLLDAETLADKGRVPLLAAATVGGRIPKPVKPDLECLAGLVWPGRGAGLLLLGSGSLPTRERGWWLPAAGPGSHHALPEALSLSSLYTLLRSRLPAGMVLNLEAATAVEAAGASQLLLFQRGLGAAHGAQLFTLPLAETLGYLHSPATAPGPAVQCQPYRLPSIGGRAAGFSGASFAQGHIFVAASVEDTADAVQDGAVLGSFVGVLRAGHSAFARLHWRDGRPYVGKVEGIALRRQLGPSWFELLLVTDDDAGGSTALVAELRLE